MASISIVIPTLNEAAVLGAALEAACRELRDGDEVWVVDAGSRDETHEIAAGRAALLVSPGPRGRQLNEGAVRARGDVLLFLHADCRLPPGALDSLRVAMADPRSAGGCFLVRFPPSEIAQAPLLAWVERGINWRTRAFRQGTGDQGLFLPRATFVESGGFREWPLMEDLDLSGRIRARGRFRVLPIPLETSARRWLRHGVVRTQLTLWGFRLAYALGASPEALGRRYAAVR
jgi:rSAM/selenodomain-associated transferase 2